MHDDLFNAALGLSEPWFVDGFDFDDDDGRLTVRVDFRRGARFAVDGDELPVHDTRTRRYRHLNFFQHECALEARVPRVRRGDGRVALVEPPRAGKPSGFTLLFEALVPALCREMPFAAVARLAGLSQHRVQALCGRCVDLAREDADLSGVRAMLRQWCTNVNRSRVEPVKAVARMVRRHLDGIASRARTRRTNGFVEALDGLFQSARSKARGCGRFETIRTVFFLIASVNPHAA